MDRVWLSAPAAALQVWRDQRGVRLEANVAAARWAASQDIGDADWHAFVGGIDACPSDQLGCTALGRGELRVHWQRNALADGSSLVWLDLGGEHERAAAVRRATEFLDRALVLAGVSVWRIDLRSQRVHFNAVGFEIAGLDQDAEGIPLPAIRDTIHRDDRAAVEAAAAEAVASGAVVDIVARYRRPDGGWRRLLTRRVADRDRDGDVIGLAGISIDVTNQVAERERADLLAARTRLVAEAMGVGFWSRDLDAGTAYWDAQMFAIHRRDPALGAPGFDDWIEHHVHPNDRAWVGELHRRATASWQPVMDATFRVADADGERWVQTWTRRLVRDGHRLAFGMHLDVTDRERAQALIQRERARMQFALEASGVGVWERALDGRIVYWSDAMFRMRGLDPQDPRPLDELAEVTVHRDDVPLLAELVRRHVERGEPYRFEFRIHLPDGRERWLATQGDALRDGSGRLLGVGGINLDITERKQADALRLEKERAEQASRDKSAFLARVSHELRTPMNAVLGFAQLMAGDPAEPPSAGQHLRLQRIADAGAQMMALVDDLLDIASLDGRAAAAPETVPVADVVHQVQRTLAGLAQLRGVELRVRVAGNAGSLAGDSRRIVQALQHLAGSALRRLGRGAWIEIGGRTETAGGVARVLLTLRDDGSAAARGQPDSPLREPLLAGPAGGADAAGLALGRRLAEAAGARIEIGAGPSGEWRMVVPAAATPAVAEAAPPLHVLYVEDNDVNQLLVHELLRGRPGVVLHAAIDGGTGIRQALSSPPDLLLLDLQLPDMGGVEVLHRLRAEPSMDGCVYVAVSADAMPDRIAAARAAGFDDYWTKPIDFERFLAGIDRIAQGPRRRAPAP